MIDKEKIKLLLSEIPLEDNKDYAHLSVREWEYSPESDEEFYFNLRGMVGDVDDDFNVHGEDKDIFAQITLTIQDTRIVYDMYINYPSFDFEGDKEQDDYIKRLVDMKLAQIISKLKDYKMVYGSNI